MSKDVFVFIEQRDNKLEKVGIELLGKARELADDLGQDVVGVLLGEKVKDHADVLIRRCRQGYRSRRSYAKRICY